MGEGPVVDIIQWKERALLRFKVLLCKSFPDIPKIDAGERLLRRCILSEGSPERALFMNDISILFKIVTICSTFALFQTLGLML